MKKIISLLLVAVLALGLFAGCKKADPEKTIRIGASPTPHAEILQVVKKELEKSGYTLEIVTFDDYVQPNTAVEDGSLDANYFQHKPYMDNFNEENGTHLVSVAGVHYEPFGIYAGTKSKIGDLASGDKIAIPNDGTNRARGLLLLEAQGLIKLKEGVGLEATVLDIVENKQNLEIVEMEAAQIPGVRDSVALCVLNGNYALGAGLHVGKDALAAEAPDSTAADTYVNILCVKAGSENSEKTKALIAAIQSEAVRNYINETYSGDVVPKF